MPTLDELFEQTSLKLPDVREILKLRQEYETKKQEYETKKDAFIAQIVTHVSTHDKMTTAQFKHFLDGCVEDSALIAEIWEKVKPVFMANYRMV